MESTQNSLVMANAPGEFMTKHAAAIFQQLDERHAQLKQQFDAIDTLNFHPTFDQAGYTLKNSLFAMLDMPGARDESPGTGDSVL